jgi:hypothetical protein
MSLLFLFNYQWFTAKVQDRERFQWWFLLLLLINALECGVSFNPLQCRGPSAAARRRWRQIVNTAWFFLILLQYS